MTDHKLLKELSPRDFMKRIRSFDDAPRVSITVEDEIYTLPKPLACSSSRYFDRLFNSGFLEAKDLKVELEGVQKQHFDLVMQWIYTGSINLDCQPPLSLAAKLTEYVAFIKLVDRIDLCGDYKVLYGEVAKLIDTTWDASLTSQHIRDTMELPKGHTLRKLIALSSASHFASSKPGFKFDKEIEELEGFSSDLFLALKAPLEAKLIVMANFPKVGGLYVQFPPLYYYDDS